MKVRGPRTTEDIAKEWRREVLSTAYWKPALNIAGAPVGAPRSGEAGGMFAESDSLPKRRVYMKPGVRDPRPLTARAAREKIASDLAHDLGITVPPVILANRTHDTAEQRVCISLVMYPQAWSWGELARKLDGSRPTPKAPVVRQLIENARAVLPRAAAHALAFDTWVFQMDHGPHNNHNIVFGYDPVPNGRYSYILLDYALAFGFGGRWLTPGHPDRAEICNPAPLHPQMLENLDRQELSRIIEQIEALPGAAIEGVVERIPEAYLIERERHAVAAGLKLRQGLLRSALATYLEGRSP